MKLLAYKGKSIVSKVIRTLTRSEYSHIAIELDDGGMIEAWQTAGVVERINYKEGHTPGTPVDVFKILGPLDTARTEKFLRDQVGAKYDWLNVFRFLYCKDAKENRRWFCSELAEYAVEEGFVTLLRGNKSHHSPRDTVMSPKLKYETTRAT